MHLTNNLRDHLTCSCYFWSHFGEAEFEDDAHRRQAWAAYRAEILEGWCFPGDRPDALWEYDYELTPAPEPLEWSWPKPVTTEPEMVRALLLKGRLAHCRFNGCVPIADEIKAIEEGWQRDVSGHVCGEDRLPAYDLAEMTYGCPGWYYREHAPRLYAEQKAEFDAWQARIERGGRVSA